MSSIDNTLLAKVLLANKLASREVLLEVLKDATPENNIGEILVEAGLLAPATYQKVLEYVIQYQRKREIEEAEAAPARVPEDGLGVPLASMLQETILTEGTEAKEAIDLHQALDPTSFQIDLDREELENAQLLMSNQMEADGLEHFRSRVMQQEIIELTPRMEQVDQLLLEMVNRGEITFEQAARRAFDSTLFPS